MITTYLAGTLNMSALISKREEEAEGMKVSVTVVVSGS